jgi:hypothetical protein
VTHIRQFYDSLAPHSQPGAALNHLDLLIALHPVRSDERPAKPFSGEDSLASNKAGAFLL